MPAAAGSVSLYDSLRRRFEIAVFVQTPTDGSGKAALDPALLKPALEKAFRERKSLHFKVVSTEAEADLTVDTQIEGFLFSETDPVDMLVGVGAAAMDAAVQDHFASVEATFIICDVKTKQILWKDKLGASVTDHTMTEVESKDKISEKLGVMLMRAAFGKKKS